jgi:hypothetical protein
MCIVEHRVPARIELLEGHMHRGRAEPEAIQHAANFDGAMVEQPGEFDFRVAGGRHLLQRTLEVALHELAHGIELQADGTQARVRRGSGVSSPRQCARAERAAAEDRTQRQT